MIWNYCRTSQLELQFSIGIVYTIGLRFIIGWYPNLHFLAPGGSEHQSSTCCKVGRGPRPGIARLGLGQSSLGSNFGSWLKASFGDTSQLILQFSIGIVYTIGLSTKVVLVAKRAWLTLSDPANARPVPVQCSELTLKFINRYIYISICVCVCVRAGTDRCIHGFLHLAVWLPT